MRSYAAGADDVKQLASVLVWELVVDGEAAQRVATTLWRMIPDRCREVLEKRDGGSKDRLINAAVALLEHEAECVESLRVESVETVQAAVVIERSEGPSFLLSALGTAYARIGDGLGIVQKFRREVLGGHVFDEEAANANMDSHAASLFPEEAFGDGTVPVAHPSRRLRVTQEGDELVALFSIDPPGRAVAVRRKIRDTRSCAFLGGDYAIGTPIARLVAVVEALIEFVPWSEFDAALFLLTGKEPAVSLVRTRAAAVTDDKELARFRGGAITQKIDNRADEGLVLSEFRRAKKALVGENRHSSPPEDRKLSAFRFAEEWMREHQRRPMWRQSATAWLAGGVPSKRRGKDAGSKSLNRPDHFRLMYLDCRRSLIEDIV